MVQALRNIQFAKETTRGTPVSATARLLGRLVVTPTILRQMDGTEERASFAEFHRNPEVGRLATFRYEGSVTFEQVINFLAMGIKGGVTPTTPTNGSSTRDWTFTPSLTAVNAPNAYTIEYGDNHQEYELSFAMVQQLDFTLALDGLWNMTASGFGRYPAKSSFTGSISAPTVEDVVARKTQIYIDSAWADLGDTAVSDTLINAAVRLPTGMNPVTYANGSLDFSGFSESKRSAEVELTLKHNGSGEAEYDKYVSGALNFIRLESQGSLIESVTPDYYKLFRIDLAMRYTEPPEQFGAEMGENTIRLVGRTFADPTSGNDMSFMARNTETALP